MHDTSRNREKFLAAGDPLPNSIPTLYRGVAGIPKYRHVRGISWTSDVEMAKWFATRFGLVKPAVYYIENIDPSLVWAHDNDAESEYLVMLPSTYPLRRLPRWVSEWPRAC